MWLWGGGGSSGERGESKRKRERVAREERRESEGERAVWGINYLPPWKCSLKSPVGVWGRASLHEALVGPKRALWGGGMSNAQ